MAAWFKQRFRAGVGEIPGSFAPSTSSMAGEDDAAVSEKEFAKLKSTEAEQALETDTLAVMVHHALYLLLPCQPVKFHFAWGRFMRFYHERDLYQ